MSGELADHKVGASGGWTPVLRADAKLLSDQAER
jgi:hypothetical protein